MQLFCFSHFQGFHSGDIQLETVHQKDLYKATEYTDTENYDPGSDQELDMANDWSGQYYALNEELAKGYGVGSLPQNGKKGIFVMNKVKVDRKIAVLNVVQRARDFGKTEISGDDKANTLKAFFRENGLGRIEDQNYFKRARDDNRLDSKEMERFRKRFETASNKLKEVFSTNEPKVMPELDRLDLGLICPHDETHDELIVNSSNVGNLRVTERYLWVGKSGQPDRLVKYQNAGNIPDEVFHDIVMENNGGGNHRRTGVKCFGGVRGCKNVRRRQKTKTRGHA